MNNDEHIKSLFLHDDQGHNRIGSYKLTDNGDKLYLDYHHGLTNTLDLNSPCIYFPKSFINSDAFDELVAFMKQRARLKKSVEVTWHPIEEER